MSTSTQNLKPIFLCFAFAPTSQSPPVYFFKTLTKNTKRRKPASLSPPIDLSNGQDYNNNSPLHPKTNIFLKSFPLFSHSNKSFTSQATPLAIKNHLNSSLFWSSNINKPINNDEKNNRVVSKTGSGILGHRRFSVKATHVNDPGSVDSPLMQSMEKKIKEHLNAESVIIKDASGDGRHVCIDVVSTASEGQSVVNRQRMVYKALWEELQNTVHAVDQMTIRTPNEAANQK